MNSSNRKISKTILSRTDHLLEVREFIAEAAREFGFQDEDTANIVLSVDEACTNIIKHAYQFARDQKIQVDVLRGRDFFEVRITDTGKPFDPDTILPPDLKRHLSQYRRGGLGVYLMRRLMDKVEYSFKPGKKNEVRLTKFLTGATSEARR